MPRIKAVIAAGLPPAVAVKAALGMTIRDFAERYRVSESAVSGVIHGSTPYLYARVRDALARHLEVERAYIDEILPPPRGRAAAGARRGREEGRESEQRETERGEQRPGAAADPPAGGADAFARATPDVATRPPPAGTGRRGRQERQAMHARATTPARITRPRAAGIAQSARHWLRLAGPLSAGGPHLATGPAR